MERENPFPFAREKWTSGRQARAGDGNWSRGVGGRLEPRGEAPGGGRRRLYMEQCVKGVATFGSIYYDVLICAGHDRNYSRGSSPRPVEKIRWVRLSEVSVEGWCRRIRRCWDRLKIVFSGCFCVGGNVCYVECYGRSVRFRFFFYC